MGRFPNIAASKAKTGAAKAKVYSSYAKEIYQVAKQGGTDPNGNLTLRHLIEKAKKEQVPADVIKRAIDKVNSGADESYTSVRYEGFASGGATVMVDCLTDNETEQQDYDNLITALENGSDSNAVAYVGIKDSEGNVFWGTGIDTDIVTSSAKALIGAVNRMKNK